MPSPFIHILFALGYGTIFMITSKGSFTALHCFVLAWSGFMGPDIGAFSHFLLGKTFPDFANILMIWLHSSIGYILFIAPLLAVAFSKLSKIVAKHLDTHLMDTHQKDITFLSVRDCYFLSVAGCLLHFQIDHLFEENGRDKLFLWIISTGDFDSPIIPLHTATILFVAICTISLVFGFFWIHLRQIISPFNIRIKHTLLLFLFFILIYFIFLVSAKYLFLVKAVVGEEADLGVLVYIVCFHFVPLLLCLKTIRD